MVTPEQLRAARALVGWSRRVLAERSGIPEITNKLFELGQTDPRQMTVHKWRRTLEKAGVVFIEETDHTGAGVRLRHPRVRGVDDPHRQKAELPKKPPPDLFNP